VSAARRAGVRGVMGEPLLDIERYDRKRRLRASERDALAEAERLRIERRGGSWPRSLRSDLDRLRQPLLDALAVSDAQRRERTSGVSIMLRSMHEQQSSFWAWSAEDWQRLLDGCGPADRLYLLQYAYLLGGFRDLHHAYPRFRQRVLAYRVFGVEPFELAVGRVQAEMRNWGYGEWLTERSLPNIIGAILLASGSARLEDITPDVITNLLAKDLAWHLGFGIRVVTRVLAQLSILPTAFAETLDFRRVPRPDEPPSAEAVPEEWASWCQRWWRTSTLTRETRRTKFGYMLRTGRWLATHHPEVSSPADVTRGIAAELVAAIDRMTVGEWTYMVAVPSVTAPGSPLSPASKNQYLGALRTLFRDGQEWDWFPRRLRPDRDFQTPRRVRDLLEPNPRVIADDVWAKLLWAGLNLTEHDLPPLYRDRGTPYPLTMVRAVVVTWLFSGLRSDELRRLRVGCVRWQLSATPGDPETRSAVCWLDVPSNKTSASFTKAVDRLVGEAIEAWAAERPTQLPALDEKTGESVHFLFSCRGRRIARDYVNHRLIPALCEKAGVPRRDVRGNITSHRARSTIASQLANSRQPMSLLDLMDWLGHRSPQSTLHYVRLAPTRVARAYEEAGYLAQNLRTIDVLIDRDVVESGGAARGEPWRFYDLGHGFCTYQFFEQCPHRMACARCSFYRPKESSAPQLREGRDNLLRFSQEIPLLDEERAAVDDGIHAMDRLLERLSDVPTPDGGPSPRERGLPS